MIDISAVPAVLTSLKTASDLAQAMIGLRDAQALQAKVIELNSVIISAQNAAISAKSEQSALVDKIRELEARIMEFENWNTEKQRYQLKDYGGGTFAYESKPEMHGADPPHRICEKCYQQREKGLLHFTHRSSGQDYFKCFGCGSEFAFGIYQSSPRHGPPSSGSWT